MLSPLLVALTLFAAPAPPPRDLRVVLDCRWTTQEQCEVTSRAVARALQQERFDAREWVERAPLEKPLCTFGCPVTAEPSDTALPTLWAVPRHNSQELHLAFTLADGSVRSVLFVDDAVFDRYRRMPPSKDGAAMDLLKLTTGLWMVDVLTGNGGDSYDDGITWEVRERVWRSTMRSLLRHGVSKQPAQLGRRLVRNRRWEVRLKSVEVTPTPAPLWAAVAEEAIGRRLEDVLDRYEETPTSLGAHTLALEFVNAQYGTGSRGFSKLTQAPESLQKRAFQLRTAVDGADLMPRSEELKLTVTLEIAPRAPRK